MALIDAGAGGQKLQRGDAKPLKMLKHRRAGKARKCAALRFWYILAQNGQAFDMRLIKHSAGPWHEALRGAARRRGIDNGLGHVGGAVGGGKGQIQFWRAAVIAEHALMQHKGPVQPVRIGVNQQFMRVKAVAVLRCIGAMGAKAIAVSGLDAGNMAMNHSACALRQNKSGLTRVLKQAKFDSRGMNGKYSDIDARFIQRHAKGFG